MKKLIQFITLLILFYGCKKDPLIDRIDSEIKVELAESFDGKQRLLKLYCSTQKEYQCSNFGIKSTLNVTSNKIEINFKSIITYDLCQTSIGPARTTIDLGEIKNGNYNISITVDGLKSEGQLTVTNESYSINFKNLEKLQLINSKLNRIPANTIWGYIGFHKESTSSLVQSFIDSLQFLGASVRKYDVGEYGYFKIDLNGNILPIQNSGYSFTRSYILNYSGLTNPLKELVKKYGKNFGDALNIELKTTEGEIFRSWLK